MIFAFCFFMVSLFLFRIFFIRARMNRGRVIIRVSVNLALHLNEFGWPIELEQYFAYLTPFLEPKRLNVLFALFFVVHNSNSLLGCGNLH